MMKDTDLQVLFNHTQIQILKLLLLNQDQSFYQREIADRLQLNLRGVQQALQRLVDSGLVLREKRGRQVYYQVNPASPILPELTSIFVKTVGLGDRLAEALQKLAEKVDVAFIFGSWANGQQRPESDVDLLVVGKVDPQEVVSALHTATGELGREFNPVVMSAQEVSQRVRDNDHFITSVMSGAKIYLIGGDSDLSRIVTPGPD